MRDTPSFPLALRGRLGVWNSHRENHLGQRPCAPHQQVGHMMASDLIKYPLEPLARGGRSLIVFHSSNPFSIFARPGSRFSSRSIKSPQHLVRSRSAARSTTSFPDVSANSRPSCAVTYILAPLGKHSVRLVSNRNLRMVSVTQLWNLATGKARLSAICCEGLRQVCALMLLAPCHGQNASRSPRPIP